MDQQREPSRTVPLRMYSKFELRCLLTDPNVTPNQLPKNFRPINKKTFEKMVTPIFSDPVHKKTLKTITLDAYKKMKLLPVQLVRIILSEASIVVQ